MRQHVEAAGVATNYPAYDAGYRSGLTGRARAVPLAFVAHPWSWLRGFDNGHRGRLLAASRRREKAVALATR